MAEDRLKLHWASYMTPDAIGNAYGYRVHHETLKRYVSKIANITEDSPDAFMIMSPEYYRHRIPDRRNWLYTMFEGTTLPELYRKSIQKADYLLTPSVWVKELFHQYFDPDRVFVVSHGVESDFTYKKRRFPKDRPFRFLWVGAPNPRKGYQEIASAWDAVFKKSAAVELYIKTTRVEGVQRNGNVILDGRNLSRRELIKLHHSAHCFIACSRGEGFHLCLAEAMRTGTPCVATRYSGMLDFFDDSVGYTIGYLMGPGVVKFIGDNLEHETEIAFPYVDELAEKMVDVFTNYKQALKKGKRASQRIMGKFTWERSAQTLVDIIGNVQKAEANSERKVA